MIQRIQTLYMLIVTALMAVTLFAPLAWFAGEAGEFGLYAFSLKTAAGEAVQPTVYMGVVLALACVLPFITIFLFKRRLLQLRQGERLPAQVGEQGLQLGFGDQRGAIDDEGLHRHPRRLVRLDHGRCWLRHRLGRGRQRAYGLLRLPLQGAGIRCRLRMRLGTDQRQREGEGEYQGRTCLQHRSRHRSQRREEAHRFG